MPNSIVITSIFSFKGETYSPSIKIDLDALMTSIQDDTELEPNKLLTSIYPRLAASLDIDSYSYAYEIMLAADVKYSAAEGIAALFLQDESFDFSSFYKKWLADKTLGVLQIIVDEYLPEVDLSQPTAIKSALLAAYAAGKNSD